MEPLYKCVWMTAGVLTFRLCDRGYDCDRCLVNQALCEGKAPAASQARAAADTSGLTGPRPEHSFRLSRHGFYDRNHTWMRVGSGGTVRVGIDDLCRRLLGPVVRVILPRPGGIIRKGAPAWTFVGEAGEVSFNALVAGKVLSRNEELIAHPGLLLGTTRREVWLARIRPARLRKDLKSLLYGRQATAWLHAQLDEVRDRLLEGRAIGVGMAPDGGLLDPAVLDRLEVSERRFLVERFLLGREPGIEGR